MTNPIKLKTPTMHGPDGQAIANRLIDRCYDASGKRLKWSPATALFLLQQIELCRELGESVRGVLHAAKIGYRTYWLFARGLTLGAAPMPVERWAGTTVGALGEAERNTVESWGRVRTISERWHVPSWPGESGTYWLRRIVTVLEHDVADAADKT